MNLFLILSIIIIIVILIYIIYKYRYSRNYNPILILCGGGRKNKYLVKRICSNLKKFISKSLTSNEFIFLSVKFLHCSQQVQLIFFQSL